MGVRNKNVLAERVRKVEENVARLDRRTEVQHDILHRIVSQQDKMLKVLESLTDGEAYHKWLKEQDEEAEKEKKKEVETKR